MKLTNLFAAVSLLFVAVPVFGQPDLTGTWCVFMSAAYSEGSPNIGTEKFYDETYEIEIDEQDASSPYGLLFYGSVDVGGGETTYFSGVLEDQTISMTHWDSVTRGTLKQKGSNPMQIEFINNAFNEDFRSSKTSVGVAVHGGCPLDE